MNNKTKSYCTRWIGVLLVTMIAWTMLAFGQGTTAYADEGDVDLGAPATEKTLTDNGDGTYTLSLSVTGKSQATTVSNKADVILIMDTSGSMNEDASGYRESATGNRGIGTNFFGDTTYPQLYYYDGSDYRQVTVQMQYTGTVYTRSFSLGGWDYTPYTGTRYEYFSEDRIDIAKDAANQLIDSLYEGAENPDDVRLSIINFSNLVHNNSDWLIDANSAKNIINSLSASGGTNWEAALQAAANKSGRDDADRYIIFVSDGNPTLRMSPMHSNATQNSNGTYGNGSNDTGGYNLAAAIQQADAIKADGTTIYAINAFGNANNMTAIADADHYYNASDATALYEAFRQIINDITQNFGYSDVVITDEVTSLTSTAMQYVDGEIENIRYTKDGEEWADAPAASFENHVFTWDLGDERLEDGVTYTASIRVWPSQEAYDLVADLQNGIRNYDDLTEEEKQTVIADGNGYALRTNGNAAVTYRQIETVTENGQTTETESDPKTSTIQNPDPIPLTSDSITVQKSWTDDIEDDEFQPNSITMEILRDDEVYETVTLSRDNGWRATIHVAPGVSTTADGVLETGHDYTVREADAGAYELDAETVHPMVENGTLVLGGNGDAVLTGENVKKGELTIAKTVNYPANGTYISNPKFTMKVTVQDADGTNLGADAGMKYRIESGSDIGESQSFVSGMEIQISKDETIRILHIPSGSTYAVQEINIPDGYTHQTAQDVNTTGSISINDVSAAIVINNYTITPKNSSVTDSISVTKELIGRNLAEGEFSFILMDSDGQQMTEAVTNAADGTVEFPAVTFEAPGTYNFIICEVAGNSDNGITYDTQPRQVVATVTDRGDGTLNVEWSFGSSNEIVIQNSYFASEVSVPIAARKVLVGRDLTENDVFTFTLEGEGTSITGRNDQNGNVAFEDELVFDEEGTYEYTMTETSGGGNGITASEEEYRMTVVVTDNGQGQLTAEVTYAKVGSSDGVRVPVFTNVYETTPTSSSVTDSISVTKSLSGRDLADGEFSFRLEPQNGAPGSAQEKTNQNGRVSFDAITFEEPGSYTYVIREVAGSADNGITYDAAQYAVVATVTDNGDGTLAVSWSAGDVSAIEFENTYEASETVPVRIQAIKTLTGRALRDGEFSFELAGTSDNTAGVSETATNDAAGNVSFDEKTYSEAGTYRYQVRETTQSGNGVTVDGSVYDVVVTVTDNGEGQLIAETSYSLNGSTVDTILFENSYEPDPTSSKVTDSISVKKVLEGRDLTDGEFEFALVGEGVNLTATNDADGNVDFEAITFERAGTYTYRLSEVVGSEEGMTYDETGYTITAVVTDNEDGTLSVSWSAGSDEITFNNSYREPQREIIVNVRALKQLVTDKDRVLQADEFEFRLKGTSDNAADIDITAKNDAAGNIDFGDITLTAIDTYTFELTEVIPAEGEEGMTYDETVHTVEIVVTKNDEGVWSAEVRVDGSVDNYAAFVNEYKPTDNDDDEDDGEEDGDSDDEDDSKPDTGDDTTLMLWLLIAGAAGGALIQMRKRS